MGISFNPYCCSPDFIYIATRAVISGVPPQEFFAENIIYNRPRGNINKIRGTAIGVEIIEGYYIRFL
jgi:hypothetical protein